MASSSCAARVTGLSQGKRIGTPVRRRAGGRSRAQFGRKLAQNILGLARARVRRQLEMVADRAPPDQGGEQAIHGGLQCARAIAQFARFADCFIDGGAERGDAADQFAPNHPDLQQLRTFAHERAGKPVADRRRDAGKLHCQLAPRMAEIRACQHEAGTDDADADFAGAIDGEHQDIAVGAAGRPEQVRGNDRGRVAGERRPIGGKILQDRGCEPAQRAPQRQSKQEADAALREAGGQDNDRNRTDQRADQPKRCFAQRGTEARLADDRRRRRSPVRFVELEPEGDVKGQAHRGPDAQSIEQRSTGGLCVREQPGKQVTRAIGEMLRLRYRPVRRSTHRSSGMEPVSSGSSCSARV